MAKIINLCLPNDKLSTQISGEERILTWKNEIPAKFEEIFEENILNDILNLEKELMNTQLSFSDSESNFAFSLNKNMIQELINQEGCEGISFIVSARLENSKPVLNLKAIPVNERVEELYKDLRFLDVNKEIYICTEPTECPPKPGCPVGIVKSFDLFQRKNN